MAPTLPQPPLSTSRPKASKRSVTTASTPINSAASPVPPRPSSSHLRRKPQRKHRPGKSPSSRHHPRPLPAPCAHSGGISSPASGAPIPLKNPVARAPCAASKPSSAPGRSNSSSASPVYGRGLSASLHRPSHLSTSKNAEGSEAFWMQASRAQRDRLPPLSPFRIPPMTPPAKSKFLSAILA